MSPAAVAPAAGQLPATSLQAWSGKLIALACNGSGNSQLEAYSGDGCDLTVLISEKTRTRLTVALQSGDCEKAYDELATLDLRPSANGKSVQAQLQAWFVRLMALFIEAELAHSEPLSSELLNSVGSLLICKAENYTLAGKILSTCVRQSPDDTAKLRAHQQIGLCFVQLTNRGVSSLGNGQLEDALNCFEEARVLLESVNSGTMQTREFAQLLTNLGIVYGKLGRVGEQRELFQRSKEKYEALQCTEHPQYQELLGYIEATGKAKAKCSCTTM